MSNPITNRYTIDRSNPEFITIKSDNDEYEIQQSHETFRVKDCFITRFEDYELDNDDRRYIQYTDINGISSELVLRQKDYDDLKEDVMLNQDYFVMAIEKLDSPDDDFYAYVTLKKDIDTDTLDKPV